MYWEQKYENQNFSKKCANFIFKTSEMLSEASSTTFNRNTLVAQRSDGGIFLSERVNADKKWIAEKQPELMACQATAGYTQFPHSSNMCNTQTRGIVCGDAQNRLVGLFITNKLSEWNVMLPINHFSLMIYFTLWMSSHFSWCHRRRQASNNSHTWNEVALA